MYLLKPTLDVQFSYGILRIVFSIPSSKIPVPVTLIPLSKLKNGSIQFPFSLSGPSEFIHFEKFYSKK